MTAHSHTPGLHRGRHRSGKWARRRHRQEGYPGYLPGMHPLLARHPPSCHIRRPPGQPWTPLRQRRVERYANVADHMPHPEQRLRMYVLICQKTSGAVEKDGCLYISVAPYLAATEDADT